MDLTAIDAKLYRGPAGAAATILMTNCRNVKLGQEIAAEANTTRRNDAEETSAPIRGRRQIEFEMINSDTDGDVTALRNAFNARAALSFRCLDKDTGKGIEWDFFVQKFDRDESDDKEQTISVVLKPSRQYRASVTNI